MLTYKGLISIVRLGSALLASALFCLGAVQAQAPDRGSSAPDATRRVSLGLEALMKHYDRATGLWETEGWWNAANSTTVLGDVAALQSSATLSGDLDNTFTKAQKKFPDFRDEFFDDEGWWALAWIQAYDVTHQEKYLRMAESLFGDMTTGWDDTCGGGIWWKKDHHYKNAIPNELFLSVAAHLAARSPAGKQSEYLGWAQREWSWFHGSGMINDQGLVNDGLNPSCKNNGRNTWTYNQGVIVGGLTELSKVTGDADLLLTANLIAHGALTWLTDPEMILHDRTEPHCSDDTVQFKGIFLRNLSALQRATPDALYARFIRANADSIWSHARTAGNEFACRWSGPSEFSDAASTTSGLDALVSAAAIR